MDQIFIETLSYRRRFIDGLCAVYENHKNIKIYEKLMAEIESKVLDNVWLDALENQMSDVQ